MKYVSLDLETTGVLEQDPDNILQISMIVEDTKNIKPLEELPHFTALINRRTFSGESYALSLNSWIFDILSGRVDNPGYLVLDEREWVSKAVSFLNKHFDPDDGKIVFAGKNVGMFDAQFMPMRLKKRISHRILDPGPMFVDWDKDDKPPGLGLVKERVGLESEVTHDAYDDALDIIKVLRTQYVR